VLGEQGGDAEDVVADEQHERRARGAPAGVARGRHAARAAVEVPRPQGGPSRHVGRHASGVVVDGVVDDEDLERVRPDGLAGSASSVLPSASGRR
jgi:hypothetical protein